MYSNANNKVSYNQKKLVIDVDRVKHQYIYGALKRSFDVLASFFALIFLFPLFLVIAFIIKIDDNHGPIFFSQVRIGKNGTKFKMYKFRSMYVGSEEKINDILAKNEITGAMFKIKDDPRVTRVGHFIRKTSLDELPQLLNVFRGEMSLVGPRPCLEREYENYTDFDKQRLLVVPGCTGLWQVSGRNALQFNQMVELDLEYIRDRSCMNDLKIIFRTIKIIFVPNEAY